MASTGTSTSTASSSQTAKLKVGSRVTIAQDCDLRGEITVASGTVIHPKCSILALDGPIEIGQNCIVEETAYIVNRTPHLLRIGNENLFEVGCRVEASSVGDHNVFEPKCRVGAGVAIGSFCTVSAQCVLVPSSLTSTQEDLDALLLGADVGQPTTTGSGPLTIPEESEEDAGLEAVENSTSHAGADVHVTPIETIPDYTTIFASGQRRNKWSGQGMGQMEALHAKHLDYLRQSIPQVHKLRKII